MPCPLANSSSAQQHSLNLIFYYFSHTPIPLGATAIQHLMPTFVPSLAAAQGLDMLAAAATATTDDPLLTPVANLLSNPGPFNPPASLPPKVAKRILDLEFVEMSEVTVDNDLLQLQVAHWPRPACHSQTFPSGWSTIPSWQHS